MSRDTMSWNTFSRKVISCQKGFMGEPEEMKPGRGDYYEFPYSCVCKKPFKYFNNESSTARDHDLGYAGENEDDRRENIGIGGEGPISLLTETEEEDILLD